MIALFILVFELSKEGKSILENIEQPFGIVSITGMYRTGKSYLMNQLFLNSTNGFKVGETVESCTRGIWIWQKPIMGTSTGVNKPHKILVLDTEGIGSTENTSKYDLQVKLISILLSSLYIYNSMGVIDEHSIEQLSFLIEIQKLLFKNEENFTVSPPNFLWILRDFFVELKTEDEKRFNFNQYIEEALSSDINGKTSKSSGKLNIRKAIKAFFNKIECCGLVRPITDEKKLQALGSDEGKDINLRSEFLEQIIALRKRVLENVPIKTINGKPINGKMLVDLITLVLDSINKNESVNVPNLWNCVVGQTNREALEKAENNYDNHIKDKYLNNKRTSSYNLEDFEAAHFQAKNSSLKLFKDICIKNNEDELQQQLEEIIAKKREYFVNIIEEDIKTNIIRSLHSFYSKIEANLHSKDFAPENIGSEINKELANVENHLVNNFGETQIKREFFNNFKSNILEMVNNYLINRYENILNDVCFRNEEEIKKIKNEYDEQIQSSSNELTKRDNEIESLKTKNKQLSQDIGDKNSEILTLNQERSNTIYNINNKYDKEIEDLKKQLKDANFKLAVADEKVKEIEREKITYTSEFDKQKLLLKQEIEYYQKQNEELKNAEIGSNKEMKSYIKEHQMALKDANAKYETKAREFNKKIEKLNEEILALQSDNFKLKSENDDLTSKQEQFESEKRTQDINYKKIIDSLKQKIENENENKNSEYQSAKESYEKEINDLNDKILSLEQKLLSSEEEFNNESIKIKNENRELKQNLELAKATNKDIRESNELMKKNQEKLLSKLETIDSKSKDSIELSSKIEELKKFYDKELTNLKEDHENEKNNLKQHIDNINSNLIAERSESESTIKTLNDKIEMLTAKNSKLERDLKKSKEEAEKLFSQIDSITNSNYSEIDVLKKEYEDKIEILKSKNMDEISKMNNTSEEQIKKLKSLFEFEKASFEQKLKSEKSSHDKKLKELEEHYVEKMSMMENELNDENHVLNLELANLQKEFEDYIHKAEREVELLKQSKDTLEKLLEVSKQGMANLQSEFKKSLEIQTESSAREKSELVQKLEKAIYDFNSTDKELTMIKMIKDQLNKDIKEKENQLNILQKEFEEFKIDSKEEIKEYKAK